jgi:hypothetical protein
MYQNAVELEVWALVAFKDNNGKTAPKKWKAAGQFPFLAVCWINLLAENCCFNAP